MKRWVLLAAFAAGFALFSFEPAGAGGNGGWDGIWETSDRYGSIYYFVLNPDGTALSHYGDGIPGVWEAGDTEATIIWENGWRDYLFNGIMGTQRNATPLSGDVKKVFTKGIRRVEAIPEGY